MWIVLADGLYGLYGGVVFCTAVGISVLDGAMLYQVTRNYFTIPRLNLGDTSD